MVFKSNLITRVFEKKQEQEISMWLVMIYTADRSK